MRYKLTIKDRFLVDGETHHNLSGYVVVFTDGVAYVADPEIVEFAKRVHFIDSIEEEGAAPVELEEVVEEVEEVEPIGVVDEDVVTMDGTGSFQPPVEEEEEDIPTAEEITALYEELGTWSEVADSLGISTATLRKYREAAGLL